MKRFLRQALIWSARLFALLVLLLFLFYLEEDWRGARDWAACQRDLAAKGETLDLRQLAPPGKPEDDLSKVPIFAELYQETEDDQSGKHSNQRPRIRLIDKYLDPSPPYTKSAGRLTDLVSWQKYYRSIPGASHIVDSSGTPAMDVLKALSQFDSILNEIDGAFDNPNAFWPIDYDHTSSGFLGGISSLSSASQVTELRAIAHLENHETDLAEKEFLFTIRLTRPLSKGCFRYGYFSVISLRRHSYDILSEGLRRHSWSDIQLREMELAVASPDILALATQDLRIERASWVSFIKNFQHRDPLALKAIQSDEDPVSFIFFYTAWIRPAGWLSQEMNLYCRSVQSHVEGIDFRRGTLQQSAFPNRIPCNYWEVPSDINAWDLIYTPLAAGSIRGLDEMGNQIAKAETYRRLARLACRLEEYRLAHGQYPDTLDALPDLPAHLNQEVLSEQPLRYHRQGDGYQLYSLGWNQKDDGGVYSTDAKEGDWPWPSP